jgi:hypothetical protein
LADKFINRHGHSLLELPELPTLNFTHPLQPLP